MEHREAVVEVTPLDLLMQAEEPSQDQYDPSEILVAAVILADFAVANPTKWQVVRARLLIRSKSNAVLANDLAISPSTISRYMQALRSYGKRQVS